MQQSSARTTIERFHESIADPDVFCGGGSAAAIAAAGGAASALLVMRLDVKRRANREQHEAINASISRTEALVVQLHHLADADIAALNVLLEAQRGLKDGGADAQDRYTAALTAAARSPLTIGEASIELLQMINDELARAGRFTVSDLGAAATLIEGACRAAFLTAEVNIALLREDERSEIETIEEIDRHRHQLLGQIVNLARSIEDTTRIRIHRHDRTSK